MPQVSLWVQEYAGLSSPDDTSPMRLVWGKERLEEELLGLRFTISPNSFFQVGNKLVQEMRDTAAVALSGWIQAVVQHQQQFRKTTAPFAAPHHFPWSACAADGRK